MARGQKRAASSPADSPVKKQKTADSSAHKRLIVPVDEGFHSGDVAPRVHIDDDCVYDAALNQTNISNNNNKFYRVQVIEAGSANRRRFWCLSRWGRVGAHGQVKLLGPGSLDSAVADFADKFKAKTGLAWDDRSGEPKKGKYTYLEREYDQLDEVVEADDVPDASAPSKLLPQVQALVKLIFNQQNFDVTLQSIGYDQSKLPLGKLGKSTLMKALAYLKELETILEDTSDDEGELEDTRAAEIEELSNLYYSTIPHVSPGRRRLPLINNIEMVKKESEMLDTLSKMEATNDVMEESKKRMRREHAEKTALIDQHLEGLKLDEVTPLSSSSNEYQALMNYLINTSGSTHSISYEVEDIFRIRRHGEWERFEATCGELPNSCRRLLWHGSRTGNFGGILSQGLRIAPPEAPTTGYMFGKGIYLADISTKSANYCFINPDESGLLLLCEAELGTPTLRLTAADYDAGDKAKAKGYIATQGLGLTVPSSWVDAGTVHSDLKGVLMPDPNKKPQLQDHRNNLYLLYNEYIVYDVAQIRLRYMIRFKNGSAY